MTKFNRTGAFILILIIMISLIITGCSGSGALIKAGQRHRLFEEGYGNTLNMCLFINPIVPRHVESVVLITKM